MTDALITRNLQWALLTHRPAPGLIVHSDQGGQYVGKGYKTLLREAKAQRSHSRRRDCYDNVQAENLWLRWSSKNRQWPVLPSTAHARQQ